MGEEMLASGLPIKTTAIGHLYANELRDIRARRARLRIEAASLPGEAERIEPCVDHGTVGLALSGGGIRSATFSLGVLQAMARLDQLRFVDYLSAVSGGGYIGSCAASLLSAEP